MRLKTKLIKENKDGSAIVELDLDKEAFFKPQLEVNMDKKYKADLGKLKF